MSRPPVFTSEELQDIVHTVPSGSPSEDLHEDIERAWNKVITKVQVECQEACDRLLDQYDYWVDRVEKRYPLLTHHQAAHGTDKMIAHRMKELRDEARATICLLKQERYFMEKLADDYLEAMCES